MGKESKIEKYLCDQTKALGGYAYKLNSVSRRGLPDRMCLFPHGVCVFVEVKTPAGKLSKLQEVTIGRWRDWGHVAVVVIDKAGVDELMTCVYHAMQNRIHMDHVRKEMDANGQRSKVRCADESSGDKGCTIQDSSLKVVPRNETTDEDDA